jgi:F-type H+-transporting ATPase subunit gamma
MEMVSLAKLRLLQKKLSAGREYFWAIEKMLNNILGSFTDIAHPLLKPQIKGKRILLCVITSDTGLCANYNHTLINSAQEFMRKSKFPVNLVAIGKKAFTYFRKINVPILNFYVDLYSRYSEEACDKITQYLQDKFLAGDVDEVWVAYTSFSSASRHKAVMEKILNIEPVKVSPIEYLVEPDIQTILESLLPLYIFSKMRFIFLNAFSAEQSIRAMAMHEATDNAKELLDNLVLLRNKLRQRNITTEITEVVSSAEALRAY